MAALIELAHDVDMDVIAEGVDTAAQVRHLRERACDLAQGYFFAPARDPDGAGSLAMRLLPALGDGAEREDADVAMTSPECSEDGSSSE